MKSRRQRAHPQGTNARNRMIGRPAMGIAREAAPDLSAGRAPDSRCSTGTAPMAATSVARPATSATALDRLPLAGTLRCALPRDARGPTVAPGPTTPAELDPPGPRRGPPGAPRLPALGQGQAPGPAAAGGPRALGLDGGPDPRAPQAQRRAAGARPTPDQRPEAGLAATVRRAQARGLRGRSPGRSRPGRHARRASPAGRRPQAVHRPRRGVPLGRARAAHERYRPLGGRVPRYPGGPMPFAIRALQVDNGSEFMAEFEQACAERGIALFILPPRSPSSTAASSGPSAPTPRSSTRSPTPRPTLADLRPAARLGDDVQHDPSPPGPGLPDPRRVPGFHQARANGGTERVE